MAIFVVIFNITLSVSLPIVIAYPFIINNIYSNIATVHLVLIPFYAFINIKIQILLLKKTDSIPDERIWVIKPFRDHSMKKTLDRNSYLLRFKFFIVMLSLIFSILTIEILRDYNEDYQYNNYRTYADGVLQSKDTYEPFTGKYKPVTIYRLHLLLPIKDKHKEITIEVSDGEYEIYKIGDKIPIIYSEKDSNIFKLKR